MPNHWIVCDLIWPIRNRDTETDRQDDGWVVPAVLCSLWRDAISPCAQCLELDSWPPLWTAHHLIQIQQPLPARTHTHTIICQCLSRRGFHSSSAVIWQRLALHEPITSEFVLICFHWWEFIIRLHPSLWTPTAKKFDSGISDLTVSFHIRGSRGTIRTHTLVSRLSADWRSSFRSFSDFSRRLLRAVISSWPNECDTIIMEWNKSDTQLHNLEC